MPLPLTSHWPEQITGLLPSKWWEGQPHLESGMRELGMLGNTAEDSHAFPLLG